MFGRVWLLVSFVILIIASAYYPEGIFRPVSRMHIRKSMQLYASPPRKTGHQQYLHRATVTSNSTLMDFLTSKFQVKRNQVKLWFATKSVLVNHEFRTNFNFPLSESDIVAVLSPAFIDANSHHGLPYGVEVLFEDSHMIVVEKPSGISNLAPIDSGKGTYFESATNNLHYHMNRYLQNKKTKEKCFVVGYSLDDMGTSNSTLASQINQDMSGLFVFAKTSDAKVTLKKSWKSFGISYHGLCEGAFSPAQGMLEGVVQVTYRTLSTAIKCDGKTYSLVELTPQLHIPEGSLIELLSAAGHSVSEDILGRLCLHLAEIRLTHPVSKDLVSIASSTPMSFMHIMSCLLKTQSLSGDNPGAEISSIVGQGQESSRNVKVFTLEEYLKGEDSPNTKKFSSKRI
jgi:23S rRNA-/tRNA-specific pseudouridylate synthase